MWGLMDLNTIKILLQCAWYKYVISGGKKLEEHLPKICVKPSFWGAIRSARVGPYMVKLTERVSQSTPWFGVGSAPHGWCIFHFVGSCMKEKLR